MQCSCTHTLLCSNVTNGSLVIEWQYPILSPWNPLTLGDSLGLSRGIDKRSSAELSEAINSMFAWYEQATIYYVYLADMPPAYPRASPRRLRCPVLPKHLRYREPQEHQINDD